MYSNVGVGYGCAMYSTLDVSNEFACYGMYMLLRWSFMLHRLQHVAVAVSATSLHSAGVPQYAGAPLGVASTCYGFDGVKRNPAKWDAGT